MINKYYVYEWFIKDTGEVFYVGKGSRNRYKSMKSRSVTFKDFIEKFDCDVRIYADNLNEEASYKLELERTLFFKNKDMAKANFWMGKNKVLAEETKQKISNTLKGRVGSTKGRRLTKEHIQKLRNAKLGTKLSDEHKKNIGNAHKGMKRSDETRQKLSQSKLGSKNPMYNKKQSQETINKRIKSLIGHKVSNETRNKIGKANGKEVKQIDIKTNELIKIFDSCSEAGRVLNINSSKISAVCRGCRKTTGGFRWEYV